MKPVKLFDDYLNMHASVQHMSREQYTATYLSEDAVNEWGSSDQNIMNQQIHKDAGSPKKMPSPFDRKLRSAAEDAVDWHWDEWPEYKRDRDGLIDDAVRGYLRSYFPKEFNMMVRMFEPVDESVQVTEGAFVVWYEDQDGKHLLGTFHNKRAAEKYKSEEEDEMLDTKGVESVGMMSKDMWDKKEAPYIKEDVNEAFIGPFVFNDRMSDEELKAMYNGALDGYANYSKGFQHSKSDYKQAYQEIEKILKKRGVSVDESAVIKGGKRISESDNGDTLGELNNMTLGQLERIEDYAEMISDRMEGGQQLDSWMFSQITVALDNLNAVHDAMDGVDGVEESQVNEKIKLIMRNILTKMIPAAFGPSTNPKMRQEIKDAVEAAIEPILTKYDYVVESKESEALAKEIDKAMIKIDDSMSYEDFADAVATILRDEYGSHNYMKFLNALKNKL